MSTTNTGIDYGRGVSNRDPETGIRYGVIAQNSISPEAFDDVWRDARDLSYEHAVSELKARIGRIENESDLADILDDVFGTYRCTPKLLAEAILLDYTLNDGSLAEPLDDDAREHIWNEIEQTFNDSYESDADRDWLYESDGYKLTNCLSTDVFVLASPFYTYAQFCSPCVPGACNLDAPLLTPPDGVFGGNDFDGDWQKISDNKCYALGHDYFDGGRAPYPVYSVATGELVAPVE